MDIGIDKVHREAVAKDLSIFLATTYALYLKTQSFHWNLEGSDFFSLHVLFQKQYEEMAEAVDEIAERIRSLGFFIEGSFSAFQKKSKIAQAKIPQSSKKMITELTQGHELLSRLGRPLIGKFQKNHDEISADLMIKRLTFHEKAAWILRSHLK